MPEPTDMRCPLIPLFLADIGHIVIPKDPLSHFLLRECQHYLCWVGEATVRCNAAHDTHPIGPRSRHLLMELK